MTDKHEFPDDMKSKNKRASSEPTASTRKMSMDFDFDEYIPLWLVRVQSEMRNSIRPENIPSVERIAKISKSEFRVLIVAAFKSPVSPSTVAETLGIDRSVVARIIRLLKKKGLIETRQSADDLRSKLLQLSDKGVSICNELIPVMRDFNLYLDKSITEHEKKTLKRILEKLLISSLSYSKNNNP